jgi:putative tryptophan/tyrosine transport system substrate-binding protein
MAIGIGRRQFICALGGSTVAAIWPPAARSQQAGKVATIGVLGGDASVWSPWTAALEERLRELGWINGRTVTIEYRWAEGRAEREAEIAAEFARLKVDVIVTNGPGAAAAKQATSVIPIVFALSPEPVAGGLVASLAHPGGNITGLSSQQTDTAGKRIELLREVVPGLRRLAIMANPGYPQAVLEVGDVQAAARAFGLEVIPLEIQQPQGIPPAFATLNGKADALYLAVDALIASNRTRIITLALGARLPTIWNNRDFVKAGGLMSYGPNFPDLFRRTAEIVDKVLHGANPADIPVEQTVKFNLAINLTTAMVLGLTIRESFLSLADEVID